MVKIKKVLNSSVVLAEDEKHAEFILLGRGIGYGKKHGEELQQSEEYQLFIPVSHEKSKYIIDLLTSIPQEILELTQTIVMKAKELLPTLRNDHVYFVLADHLHFALQRYAQNMVTTNRLIWEIQNFHPKEYEVALQCLHMVNEKLSITLPEEEAVNIAFHLINAQATNNPEYDSARYVKLVGELVSIVQYSLNKNLDKTSIHYFRFVTHIRFFVERFFTDKMLSQDEDCLYARDKHLYPKEVEIVNRIKSYLYDSYHKLITDEELSFLMIHINRMNRD